MPCIGLEFSGKTPTPIVASPATRNKKKKVLDIVNFLMLIEAATKLAPRIIVERL